jgi:hypothetical protein
MLLQKTLHMSQSLAECKACLASIHMVTRATVTSSKTAHFSFRGPLGFEAHTVLLSVESDSPDQYAFEPAGGNINLMGIVNFAEIRKKLFAWLDRRLRFLDTFVTTELRSIRALENGRTGLGMWDALERKTAINQIGTLSRWNKGGVSA